MSSEEIAISVRDVSKHYLMFSRPEHRLKQMVVPRLQRAAGMKPRKYYRDFAALDGVSFDVSRGETVGIIGRNGSGKSTLLQIVCGTLNPTRGKVTINGRIAALLELGAGFNPEFSGRENVYLNATILGLKRHEVDERFEAIADFADIGEFIDQPVKMYSSGMYVRLAFATAINVDPDILIVDEALAVGDEAFRRKCYARIEEIQDRGGTILFVSHGAQTIVQLCSRAILFDAGELLLQGDPKTVTGQYQRLINVRGDEARKMREEIRAMDAPPVDPGSTKTGFVKSDASPGPGATRSPSDGSRRNGSPAVAQQKPAFADGEYFDRKLVSESRVDYQSYGARIRDLRLLNAGGEHVNVLVMGRRYTYEYFVDFETDAAQVGFGMMVNTVSGLNLGGGTTSLEKSERLEKAECGVTYRVRFEFLCCFLPGTYFMNAGIIGDRPGGRDYLHRIIDGLCFRVAPVKKLVSTGLVDIGPVPTIEMT